MDSARRYLVAAALLAMPLLRGAAVAQVAPLATPSPGTARMAERLRELAEKIDLDEAWFLSGRRTAALAATPMTSTEPDAPVRRKLRLATGHLEAGDLDAAFAELDEADAALAAVTNLEPEVAADLRHRLLRQRALSCLRLGEVENCLQHPCCGSCIAPIEGGGVHANPRGSRTAIPLFEQLLKLSPDDRESRWLLNLAHMTLGSWPDGVAEPWQIVPSAFVSDRELPRMHDVAAACGLAGATLSGGACTEDFNGDGLIDVMTSSIGLLDPLHLFLNQGDGHFTERPGGFGVDGITSGLNLTHADYDNDGDADVLVLRGAWMRDAGALPNSLLRNRGDGTFDDVTEEAGLLSFHPTQTAAWGDLDGDGWLDLVIGNETSAGTKPHPCELFLNHRDGTFVECAAQAGSAIQAFVKGVAIGDIDDDGRPDLFFSVRVGPNVLLHNVADSSAGGIGFRLVDITKEAGVERPRMGFPTWFFDYDNDGRQDLFVGTNHGFQDNGESGDTLGAFLAGEPTKVEMPKLYHNLGGGHFEDVSKATRIDRALHLMGGNFGDVDNDGWLDVYLGTGSPSLAALLPNKLFHNDRGQTFEDVTTATATGHLQKGHAVAFADFDNDGDQDLFAKLGGAYDSDVAPSALFENPGHGNHWITLRLVGVKANRCAIGTRIRVEVVTPRGLRSSYLVAGTGGSFGSSSLQQEIGLGDATAIARIVLRWPGSGTLDKIEGPPLDGVYRIVEGSRRCEPVAVRHFKLGKQ